MTARLKKDSSIYVSKKIQIKGNLDCAEISNIKDYTYTGKNIEPNITIKDGTYTLIKNKDYKLEYKNNKNCGIANVKIIGIGLYEGSSIDKTFKIIPNKVENLKIISRSDTSLTLNWNKLDGITAYKVYLYNDSKGKYEYYGKTNKTSIKIKKLKSATNYKIKVRAYKNVNGSQYFGEYSTRIKSTTAPKKVNKLKVKAKSKNSVKLNWNKVSGVTGYKVYIYNAKTKKYEYYGKTKSTSIIIKKLSKNKSYKIKVRAYKTFQGKQYLGEKSNVLKVKTLKK